MSVAHRPDKPSETAELKKEVETLKAAGESTAPPLFIPRQRRGVGGGAAEQAGLCGGTGRLFSKICFPEISKPIGWFSKAFRRISLIVRSRTASVMRPFRRTSSPYMKLYPVFCSTCFTNSSSVAFCSLMLKRVCEGLVFCRTQVANTIVLCSVQVDRRTAPTRKNFLMVRGEQIEDFILV